MIAENLDSVNDVAKKIEVLDSIQSTLSRLGNLDRVVDAVEERGRSQSRTGVVKVEEDRGGWEPVAAPNIDMNNLVGEVVSRLGHFSCCFYFSCFFFSCFFYLDSCRVDKKLCEFGSMIEGNLDRIERELKDESGAPIKLKSLVEITKALTANSLKVRGRQIFMEILNKLIERYTTWIHDHFGCETVFV